MKKLLLAIIIVCLVFSFGVVSFASEESQSLIAQSGIEEIRNDLDEQTKEFLHNAGADKIDYESLFSLNFRQLSSSIMAVIRENVLSLKEYFFSLAAAVCISVLSESMRKKSPSHSELFPLCTTIFIALVCVAPLTELVSANEVIILSACRFFSAIFPILCAIAAAGGKALTASVFEGGSLIFSQIISQGYISVFVPLCNMLLGLGMASVFDGEIVFSRIISLVKKYLLIFLSAGASLYFTVLGIKGNIGSAVDESGMKALKFAAGNFVPVIGGAISDSAGAVLASLTVTKSAIGAFGMLCLAAIFLPGLVKTLLWMLCFELSAALAGVFSLKNAERLLKCLASILGIFAIMLVFLALMMFINVGTLSAMKGTV